MEVAAADSTSRPTADVVVLQLPASSAYLSILRTATAGLAARLQFTLDEIEDLRIAVDEACAMLLASHPAAATTRVGELLTQEAELSCRFLLLPDQISVEVSLPSQSEQLPNRNTFAWQVLNALAGDVDAVSTNGRLAIRLTKKRSLS